MANTQQITRKNLKEIYDSISTSCGWRKKIEELVFWNDDKTILVSEEMILSGHNQANTEQKKLIEKYFKVTKPEDICDRIQDWDDILEINGLDSYKDLILKPKTKEEKSINAFSKFLLICKAYNGDWEANIKNTSQNKYYIYRYYSGGVLDFVVGYRCHVASCSLGLHLKERKYAEDITKKFPKILEDYFMI